MASKCVVFRGLRTSSYGLQTPSRSRSVSTRARTVVVAMATARALVPIANGSEEMEAVIIIDVLRRAGTEVTVASVEDSLSVSCSRGVIITADKKMDECTGEIFDLIALPGGMPGAERLGASQELQEMLKKQKSDGRIYAAICASPGVVFEPAGLLEGKKGTVHPAFVDNLADKSAVDKRVVVDGTCTTSRGPGTAFEFALSLVRQLHGEQVARDVAGPMVMYDHELA